MELDLLRRELRDNEDPGNVQYVLIRYKGETLPINAVVNSGDIYLIVD